MPKPCRDRHPAPADNCLDCWLAANDRRYQALWGLPVTAPEVRPDWPDFVRRPDRLPAPADAHAPPCAHLGGPTGELVKCPTCAGGRVKLKVRACELFGRCTPGKKVEGLACCVGCGSYEAPPTS